MKNPLYLFIGGAALAVVLVIGLTVRMMSDEGGASLDKTNRTVEGAGKQDLQAAPATTTGFSSASRPDSPRLDSSASPSASDDGEPLGPSLPLVPEPQVREAEISLWQSDSANPDTLLDGNPAARLHTNPELVKTLHVGQKLHLEIPQRNAAVEAEIASTYNLTPRTQVWQGKVVDGHPQDNVTVTRGELETHVTIATFEGTYSAIIDNATGDTVMVDEGDITANQIPFEDGISVDPIEQQPPTTAP